MRSRFSCSMSKVDMVPLLFVSTLLLAGTVPRTSSQAVSFGLRKLAYSTNQFGLDLMRALDRSEAKSAFCPVCISSSLSMMLVGATGTTASSLRHALYLWGMSPSEINMAYYDMMTHLGVNLPVGHHHHQQQHGGHQHHHHGSMNSVYSRRSGLFSGGGGNSGSPMSPVAGNSSGNDVAFLNNVYVQRDYPVNYHYHLMLQRFYKTAVHPLDFHYNGEETLSHINAIVEKQTSGKIKNILPLTRSSTATQLLLLSALYFRGTLDLELEAVMAPPAEVVAAAQPPLYNANVQGPSRPLVVPSGQFFADEDGQVWLEARSARIRYAFSRYLNCTTVEMPFKGGLITLVAMMPADPNGLDTLLTRLSAQVLTDVVGSLEVTRVNLRIPRLNINSGAGNLTWTLSNLGLADLFKPGYSQLYDVSDYKWLAVTDIVHKTVMDIKEPTPSVSLFQSPTPLATEPLQGSSATNPIKHLMYNQQRPIGPQNQFQTMSGAAANVQGQQSGLSVQQPQAFDKNSVTVNFDKPFIYFVFDNVSGLVLVMGKMGREPATYRLPV